MPARQVTTYRDGQLAPYRVLLRTSIERGVAGKAVGAAFVAMLVVGCASVLPFLAVSTPVGSAFWVLLCVTLAFMASRLAVRAIQQLARWGGTSVTVELADDALVIGEPVAGRVRVRGKGRTTTGTVTLAARTVPSRTDVKLIPRIVTRFHHLATLADLEDVRDVVLTAPTELREHNSQTRYWLEVALDDLWGEPLTARFDVRVVSPDESSPSR